MRRSFRPTSAGLTSATGRRSGTCRTATRRGNSVRGKGVVMDGAMSTSARTTRLTTVLGVDDVIVVTTDDAVLVLGAQHGDKVKQLVDELKRRKFKEAREHSRVYRPWGYYQSIDNGDRHQVKRIVVKPGHKLSLQKHYHRAEHWIVVRGAAEVTRDNEVTMIHENEFDLPADGLGPSPGQSGQDRPRADRGADRLLSRRGRHRPHRGRLSPRLIFPPAAAPRLPASGFFAREDPMFPKPVAVLTPNTFEYERLPLVKPTGFREYDARWLFGSELNLMGVQALGPGPRHAVARNGRQAAARDRPRFPLLFRLDQTGLDLRPDGGRRRSRGHRPRAVADGLFRAIRAGLPGRGHGHGLAQRQWLDRRENGRAAPGHLRAGRNGPAARHRAGTAAFRAAPAAPMFMSRISARPISTISPATRNSSAS